MSNEQRAVRSKRRFPLHRLVRSSRHLVTLSPCHTSLRSAQALVILLFLLVACGGSGEAVYGNDQLLSGDAVVVCSQACAERGQCGERLEVGGQVVLASETGPATVGHSFVLPDQATVAIVEARAEQVVQTADQAAFPLNFYYVTDQVSGRSGWVAGWCVAGHRPP